MDELSKHGAEYLKGARAFLGEIAARWAAIKYTDHAAQRQELNEAADRLEKDIPASLEDAECEALANAIHDYAGELQTHADGTWPGDLASIEARALGVKRHRAEDLKRPPGHRRERHY